MDPTLSQHISNQKIMKFKDNLPTKGVAATTDTLVLDRGDSTLLSPVNSGREGRSGLGTVVGHGGTIVLWSLDLGGDGTLELLVGHVRKVVDGNLVGLGGIGIVGVDEVNSLLEDLESGLILSFVSVDLVVL